MEQLIVAEETYRDSVPENLQGAKWHEAAEHSLAVMQEIIDLLHDIYWLNKVYCYTGTIFSSWPCARRTSIIQLDFMVPVYLFLLIDKQPVLV